VDVEPQAENVPVDVGGEVEATSRVLQGGDERHTCRETRYGIRTTVLDVWWNKEILIEKFMLCGYAGKD
jgi:hypothetical protein